MKGKEDQRSLGLALGAGGARGLAHIGVLEVLCREGIRLSAISGTSMGAIVGGAFAVHNDFTVIEAVLNDFLASDLYRRPRFDQIKQASSPPMDDSISSRLTRVFNRFYFQGMVLARQGLFSRETFESIIDFFIPPLTFDQAQIPFCSVALDLRSGREAVFTHGDLRTAVKASAAMPGLVSPMVMGESVFCDGQQLMSVPVEPLLRRGVEVIAAVDVDRPPETRDDFNNILEVVIRADECAAHRLKEIQISQADQVIRPVVDDYHWSDFKYALDIVAAGKAAAEKAMPQLKELIRPRKKWLFFR